MRRKFFGLLFVISLLWGVVSIAQATTNTQTSNYNMPKAFMDLFYDFTGNNNPGYPKGKINIVQALYNSEIKQGSVSSNQKGDLILFVNSTLYVYGSNRKLKLLHVMRTAPNVGFYQMTAISHIGPALAYLAKIKQNGSDSWKPQMKTLLKDIKAVQKTNAENQNNWLYQLKVPAWKPYLSTIHNMVSYACAMSISYIESVLSGKETFNMQTVQDDFFDGNKSYPIPFDNVMIGTFMLTALQSMTDIHADVSKLNIDWPDAKVIIRFVAGGNVTAGVSAGSNWLVPFVVALSNNTIPKNRIYIAPYTQIKPSLGKSELTKADYSYYNDAVWGQVYNRTQIAKAVFTTIPTIFLPDRPAIPGDYKFSKNPNITDFIIRLKYSLSEPTEMLSNSVGFWLPGELTAHDWNYKAIQIPGVTTGFPKGITTYPNSN